MASKPDDPASTQAAAEDLITETSANAQVESEDEDEAETANAHQDAAETSSPAKKKKKSKKKRIKAALGIRGDGAADGADKQKEKISKAVAGMSQEQVQQLLSMNPSLAQELSANSDGRDLTGTSLAEGMKRLKVRSSGRQCSRLGHSITIGIGPTLPISQLRPLILVSTAFEEPCIRVSKSPFTFKTTLRFLLTFL